MMARFISKILLLREATTSSRWMNSPCSSIVTSHHHHHHHHNRNQSSQSTKPKSQLAETEREENDAGLKLLEDHIQRFMVIKATPDWLPFLPGSSFWVPPTPSPSTFFHNITALRHHHYPLSLSLRGSPDSQKLLISENESGLGGDSGVPVEVNSNTLEGMEVVTVKVKVLTIPENISLTEDEEG